MLSTMPRRIASSATSCCDHWVIGRSLADGGSQAMAMMAQICSAPNLAGAPLFGASDRRAATATPGALDSQTLVPSAHRLRPHPETARDLAHADAVIAMQDHARAQRHLLRRGMAAHETFQGAALLVAKHDRDGGQVSHRTTPWLPRTSDG